MGAMRNAKTWGKTIDMWGPPSIAKLVPITPMSLWFMVPIYLILYYLGKFHHDLTATEPWNHGFYMGNHPQMAARFRLVKYYNLPRDMWGPQDG